MEDRISELSNDLLDKILLLVSTKDAVATMVLSKRWRFVWRMVPKFEYKDTNDERKRESACRFLDRSLKLHKAPVIETLSIQLRRSCDPVDFGKWIANAVDRYVRVIEFELLIYKLIKLPTSLYTCKTLVELTLSNMVLVDVPSSAYLPSLKKLLLVFVVCEDDENSLFRLLSGCSVLARSTIRLYIYDYYQDSTTSIKNVTLTKAMPYIHIFSHSDYNILSSLPLVTSLTLYQNFRVSFSGITFSSLQRFELLPVAAGWSYQLLLILDKSPNLRFLHINSVRGFPPGVLAVSKNQQSSVPRCLLSHLHIFEWKEYRGSEEERELVMYIFANSVCLKKATFTLRPIFNADEGDDDKMVKELKSMSRVSPVSQLLFE